MKETAIALVAFAVGARFGAWLAHRAHRRRLIEVIAEGASSVSPDESPDFDWVTPGAAEGDRETIEDDLERFERIKH